MKKFTPDEIALILQALDRMNKEILLDSDSFMRDFKRKLSELLEKLLSE